MTTYYANPFDLGEDPIRELAEVTLVTRGDPYTIYFGQRYMSMDPSEVRPFELVHGSIESIVGEEIPIYLHKGKITGFEYD